MTDSFVPALLDRATVAYRRAGRFAYHCARGKLGGDPIFRHVLQHGLIPSDARLLDLGCGQAAFASWLLAARKLYDAGHWPHDWAAAPRIAHLRGVELMPRDVERAHQALGDAHPEVEIVRGDIREVDFGQVDAVTILDVLHYLGYDEQEDVLRRVRDALPRGGRLITRVGDANGGWRFRTGNAIDLCVAFSRGLRLPTMCCRSLRDWTGLLERLGFSVRAVPMSHGKPFANVMLVAQLPA
ncbi:MAG: class I SAM-dependent methyltransferase [Aromatoleum sp.]|uniref:SAM-dependent methyltransferase n=1 Tax=Aromatoleum sp. TaxID=2307007 RepID=UPI0028953AE2|nr:class I SAM-dependent methyltransferase [Aromatoleum sp.]MDT3669729.1 class I SAM-dependent methyltransferase [Aromatoleum sp.]